MTISPAESHLDVRVVVHTHWDREWYRPEPRFRQRLVALVDDLLDRPAGGPILLDGQSVLLEDYLSVRPERAADLSSALRRGSLEAGPWYVLADELIPSGEGLVRNLLAGRRALSALRASAPSVLYCPDSFGHPAALPALAAGFGCPVIILWRGYGGQSHPAGDTARWAAPDGSSAVIHHLPPDGYEFGSHLPVTSDAAASRWESMRRALAPRALTGLVILPAGADHHAPPPEVDTAVTALSAAAAPDAVARSSLAAASDALVTQVAGRRVPRVEGELRDSYGYTWTLQGTFGSRAADKRRYRRAERALLRDLEPWVALAPRAPAGRDRRHLLRAAWRPLLLCQPHDTLCGCSVDEVAEAMRCRLAESEAAADELREAALADLLGHDPAAVRRQPDDWSPTVVVRNPCARARAGIAEVTVDTVLAESPVGPASAGIRVEPRSVPPISLGQRPLVMQPIDAHRTFAREESPTHYPRNRLVARRRVLVSVPELPGYGLATIPIVERRRRPTPPVDVASAGDGGIANGAVRVRPDPDGLTLLWSGGRTIDDWITLEAEGEQGDLYTASPMPGTRVVAMPARSRVTARGPLRAELATEWRVRVPARRLTSAAGEARIIAPAALRLRTSIQLDAGTGFVRVHVAGEQITTDLRLRAVFRTDVAGAVVRADAAFATVQRNVPPPSGAGEAPPPTAPLQRYVTLTSADRGATLFSDGLAEYEARADGSVAVTLLRAVGELSRHDLPERPGHAGWPVEVPGAQQRGPFEASFGYALHGPWSDAIAADVETMADDILYPLTGETWRSLVAPPASVRGVELVGAGLAMSAAKPAEDGDGLVVRCVNLLDRDVPGAWILPGMTEAGFVRLDESPLSSLRVEGDRVAFTARPHAIVSIRVR